MTDLEHRVITVDNVVHHAWSDEWAYYGPWCQKDGKKPQVDVKDVVVSQQSVTCIDCINERLP